MGDLRIDVLGVYRVQSTPELFQQAIEWKYGTDLDGEELVNAEKAVREELESIVLIEVQVRDADDTFDVGDFEQPHSGQLAWAEAFLSADGNEVLSRWDRPDGRELRVAFFLHFFDASLPVMSSCGELLLPELQEMPDRLRALVPYELVD